MARNGVGGRVVPVDIREVDAQTQPLAAARLRQLPHEVPRHGRRIPRVEVGGRRAEHAEAVVVLGREYDRPHPRLARKARYGRRIERPGIERRGHAGIPVAEDSRKGLYLLAVSLTHRLSVPYASGNGVEPEMYEHRIFVAVPALIGPALRRRSHRPHNTQTCHHIGQYPRKSLHIAFHL